MTSAINYLAKQSPIKFERFESRLNGFFTAGRDSRMIAYAQSDAEEWMNNNSCIEVISIDTTCTRMLACVTIWYRESQADAEQGGDGDGEEAV
ncbi:hypothetical protein HZ994_09510 [Akkermansiaceae bacterium]|nr:hypothetical protein HZ994_09510 [Akkermansiaceae bacterium]